MPTLDVAELQLASEALLGALNELLGWAAAPAPGASAPFAFRPFASSPDSPLTDPKPEHLGPFLAVVAGYAAALAMGPPTDLADQKGVDRWRDQVVATAVDCYESGLTDVNRRQRIHRLTNRLEELLVQLKARASTDPDTTEPDTTDDGTDSADHHRHDQEQP